ncbi:triose-phosphate isomerase [Thermogymnomonas acidicola]|uniref:Triose-phosphate isomerase n=1 Tax=Thermogymnomonas acidicola TaxID=399579 RepID=A0AA37F991_9ARCH|nr:triose-phosphate isomerase [Thermogymnomonas acidicola]GGM70857.1 triose-phosphate isomerase [Thermogymnomonas acidicola]
MADTLYIVNLKHYRNAVGRSFRSFMESMGRFRHVENVVFAIPHVNFPDAHAMDGFRFFAQDIDPSGFGAYTGSVSMDVAMEYGISGTLLNHSERRVSDERIASVVQRAASLSFDVVLCARDAEEVRRFSSLNCRYIAYEPPELIGGNISVSTARPEVIRQAVEIARASGKSLLVGAGIKSRGDVEKSIDLGASGILVASGVVLANSPPDALSSLIV